MKNYFAYIRVSTVKQGEKGSSLQEQKSAIEGYARKHNLSIFEWFEEKETAAKLGRPVFNRMLKALDRGLAAGVITHKIDRSARNLKDWATLGELIDRGIEMHFAYESIDLTSRGGRLSADIQAVVAADFIRNLRDEVRKGFYGRLKQGLYPLSAPLGYLDQGGGVPKTIDPVRGPIVAQAFDLYATESWSLQTLAPELFLRGLRNRMGGPVTRNGLSSIFNNSFYIGIIRLRSGETFQGVHAPLIDKSVFDRVQSVLQGRVTHKAIGHKFRYQRLLRCVTCGFSLIAERQKGYVYYRCQTRSCPTTCLREEKINDALREVAARFRIPHDDWDEIRHEADTILADAKTKIDDTLQSLTLAIAAIDDRLGRLTDGYIDRVIDRNSYLARKEQLLDERATLTSRKAKHEADGEPYVRWVEQILELVKALGAMPDLPTDVELRDLLKTTTSNFGVQQKNVAIAWANPFNQLLNDEPVTSGGLERIKPRTAAKRFSRVLIEYIRDQLKEHRDDDVSPTSAMAA